MQFTVEGIGNRIRERRKALGLTQRELAARIGVGQDVVSKHEKDRLGIGAETLMRYAKELETTAEFLAGASPQLSQVAAAMQGKKLQQVPVELARFLSDGRCNPISDDELEHLARHISDGNSTDPLDLEIHLLAHRAEKTRTDAAISKFRDAVHRARKARSVTTTTAVVERPLLAAPEPARTKKKAHALS